MDKTPHLAQEQKHGSEEIAIIQLFFVPIYKNQNPLLSCFKVGEKKFKIMNYVLFIYFYVTTRVM